jgi:hypothetical protein
MGLCLALLLPSVMGTGYNRGYQLVGDRTAFCHTSTITVLILAAKGYC